MHLPYCIITFFGSKIWHLNGKIHRTNGPASEAFNGIKFWLINGQLHREDGPAIEYPHGTKVWYYEGKYINCSSQKEFEKLLQLKTFW